MDFVTSCCCSHQQ